MSKALQFILLVTLVVACKSASNSSNEFERNIKFYALNYTSFGWELDDSDFNSTIRGCDPNGNLSMIVHGWTENLSTTWIKMVASNLRRHRGGCIYCMDYSVYSKNPNYGTLVSKFENISAVLSKKLIQIGNYEREFIFGFSFGARVAVDAALKVGKQAIGRMDLCDPAGPGFNKLVDSTLAAKNVQCINTSNDKGTNVYNCHQNFRMGNCGQSQAASGPPPLASHGLCPYFYNLAFTYDYTFNNYYGCSSPRMVKNPPSNVKMGYFLDFNGTRFRGDIFVATAKYPPFVVKDNVIDNHFQSLMEFESLTTGRSL